MWYPQGVQTQTAARGRSSQAAANLVIGWAVRSEAFAFDPLPLHLSGTAHGFRRLTSPTLRRLLVVPP